jgi:hypothetical protein
MPSVTDVPHAHRQRWYEQALADDPRDCSALTATSTLAFRRVVHTKVNAVVLFCFIDKKIFQNVLPEAVASVMTDLILPVHQLQCERRQTPWYTRRVNNAGAMTN